MLHIVSSSTEQILKVIKMNKPIIHKKIDNLVVKLVHSINDLRNIKKELNSEEDEENGKETNKRKEG